MVESGAPQAQHEQVPKSTQARCHDSGQILDKVLQVRMRSTPSQINIQFSDLEAPITSRQVQQAPWWPLT